MTVIVEFELTALSKIEDRERAEILSTVAKQAYQSSALPYGVTLRVKSVRLND